MSNPAVARNPLMMLAPLVFGAWAAAIAVAPTMAAKAVLASPALVVPFAWWTLARPGRWLGAFFAAALLLPPLPIPIGDSGPHPALLFALLGIFAGVVWLGEWRLRLDAVSASMLALWAVMLGSVAMAAINSGLEIAAGSLARAALFGIAVYCYFYTVHGPGQLVDDAGKRRMLRWIYYCAAGEALFACVDFYFQFPAPAGFGPQFVWLDSGVFRRAQGLFYEASTLGNFCTFFLVGIAVAFSRPRAESPVSRKGLLAGGALFLAALVLSYSRGSLINLLIASAVLVWSNRRRVRLTRVVPALAVSAAVTLVLIWQVFPAFADMYWYRLWNTTLYAFSATEGLLSGRVASWNTLVDWIAMHPWQAVVGIGYKTLPYSSYVGGAVVGDNMYLSLLVETGIAGFAALMWMNAAILRAAARASHSPDARVSFCGTWMLCFWAGEMVQMLSGDLLTYWRVLPVYFCVLAFATRV